MQLKTAAAHAMSQMPAVAHSARTRSNASRPARSMPITAQNTTSRTTFGFVSA
jgi:hypothetical protein